VVHQASLLVLVVVVCSGLPTLDEAPELGDVSEIVNFIQESMDSYSEMAPDVAQDAKDDVVTSVDEDDSAAKNPKTYTYAGTLQHVANRMCSERTKKKGAGGLFCQELIALQKTWVSAEARGDLHSYTGYLGQLKGHYCPDSKSTQKAKCLITTMLVKAVPAQLRWNADRKRYLQLTKDVATHYCAVHGEHRLFCPLMKSLQKHFFEAVMTTDADKYSHLVKHMKEHYCDGPDAIEHPADERCSIFPLLLKAIPTIDKSEVNNDAKVLENGGVGAHNTPGTPAANVPGVDAKDGFQFSRPPILPTPKKP